MLKLCPCCNEEKDISLFGKGTVRKDGLNPYCLDCDRLKSKQKYSRNTERSRELKRQQYQKFRPENRLRYKQYYNNNKEAILIKTAAYHKANPEINRQSRIKWVNNNRDKVNAKDRRWRRTESGRRIQSQRNHNRKASLRGAAGHHTLLQWELLKSAHNFTCLHCERKEPEIKLTRDHIIPISKGGHNNIENIQPLCGSCNSKKRNKIVANVI